jgi:teichuronic acid biosynthesis glycosyltransferase TuaC
MRILTFTTLFPNRKRPDFGIFIYQRVAHVAERPGNMVQVVAPVPYFPSWIASKRWGIHGQIPREEMIGGLRVHHPRYVLLPGVLMPLHGLLMFLGSAKLARRLHQEFHFDCIDAHYVYPDGFAAVLLGKMLKVPVVVSARGTDINVFPSFRTIRPMIRWTLRHAAGLVAVSGALKATMMHLGAPADKIVVIANGVDAKRFHPMPRAEARRNLQLPLEAKIVLSVGSLTEGKNHPLLISAFTRISEGHPEYRLYIVGEGPLHSELDAMIHKSRMEEKVLLAGARPNEELAWWFNAADVSCLVSSREGGPNVLIESLACGTPVVAARAGGVPEIIVSPELGILVERNEEDVAAGLRLALTKGWDRETLSQHAQSRGWDQVAREVEEYLASRIARGPG